MQNFNISVIIFKEVLYVHMQRKILAVTSVQNPFKISTVYICYSKFA